MDSLPTSGGEILLWVAACAIGVAAAGIARVVSPWVWIVTAPIALYGFVRGVYGHADLRGFDLLAVWWTVGVGIGFATMAMCGCPE